MNKFQLLQKEIKATEAWLTDEKIFNRQELQELKQKHDITLERIVVIIERYFVPAQKDGVLTEFVKDEITRLKCVKPINEIMERLQKTKFTAKQVEDATDHIHRMIIIIGLPTINRSEPRKIV